MKRRPLGRFLYATIWTILSAAGGHFESAIDGQNPSAQALHCLATLYNESITVIASVAINTYTYKF